MQIEKRSGGEERQVLIGMIVDRSALAKISLYWKGEMFRNAWSNLIGGWCVDYFRKTDEAPGRRILALFETWSEETPNDELVEIVERFLASLSEQYETFQEEINSAYLMSLAERHFNRNRLLNLSDKIVASTTSQDFETAMLDVAKFNKVELSPESGIDVISDRDAIRDMMKGQDANSSLINYPGDLGRFFGNAFERDSFVAFMAPEKRGKTWWLGDLAWQAIKKRRKVAFFSAGDMSQNQMMRRFYSRATKKPFNPAIREIKIPIKLKRPKKKLKGDIPVEVTHFVEKIENPLSISDCFRAAELFKRATKTKETLLRLSCHPNNSLSVQGISNLLEGWELQYEWRPDVIVIDYADILAPPFGVREPRDKINETWKELRALSQRLHCSVVTATQADAASYGQFKIGMQNFSNDKRILAHVTGMIGINQTSTELERELYRLSWVVQRSAGSSHSRFVYTASCLDIANPAVKSCF